MRKFILAATVGTAMAFAALPAGTVLAQGTGAEQKAADDIKAKSDQKAADRKAKADERKAKAAERRKEKAEKKATASAARAAFRARQKQCGAEWKEARRAGKVDKHMTWPKYWSECNTRLKAKAA